MASGNARSLALRMAQQYFGSGAFKFMLTTGVPSDAQLDSWSTRSQVANEHPATGGYTAGGFDVTVESVTLDAENNRAVVEFSVADPALSDVTLAGVVGGWLYKAVGSAATDELCSFVDYGSAKGVTNGNFRHTFTAPLYVNA